MKNTLVCLLLGMCLPVVAVAKPAGPVVTIAKVIDAELTEDMAEVRGSSKLYVNPGSKDGPGATR